MCAPVVSVNVVYIDRHGERREIRGKVGDNALYLAYRYGIEMEGELQNATVLIVVLSSSIHFVFACPVSVLWRWSLPTMSGSPANEHTCLLKLPTYDVCVCSVCFVDK